ncbi:HNH endonuclease [Amphritea sp. HPY]|uniref:HNH endonuclease n=1 Tax=Amphritea sp. HPY TaxID=3421652 RepID=UPI003D7CC61F
MKLDVDLSGLWASVKKMGEHDSDFTIDTTYGGPGLEFDDELSSTAGMDIQLEDLELDKGVLSVHGRQVLLFIPDQGSQIMEVMSDGGKGKKFHVADCVTLNEMRRKKRFQRYKATYNVSGTFQVYGTDYHSGDSIEGEAELKVCKNCLKYLNYKGYQTGAGLPKSKIFQGFDIAAFLSEYSTLFKTMPDRAAMIDMGGYSDDWREVSSKYRQSVNYTCESCSVELNEHRQLLHTHHINGNKRDNHSSNLKALCIDCHRKQPLHDYMRVRHEDMVLLTHLRKAQGYLETSNWDEVIEMADKALDGLLRHYEKKGTPLPEVGYELCKPDQSVAAELEIAWPKMKKGIAISNDDLKAATELGWNVLTVGQALSSMNP